MRYATFILALLLGAAGAGGGTVRTLDGKSYDGDVRLDKQGVLWVTPKNGAVAKVELANILDAVIRAPEAPKSDAPLVTRWEEKDIGRGAGQGAADLTAGTLTVKSFGAEIGKNADALHFYYQGMTGDFEAVARLVSVGPGGRAGIIVRQSLEPGAAAAGILLGPVGGDAAAFLLRARAGGGTMSRPGPQPPLPQWLKLVRSGNSFSAYLSEDGRTWQWLGADTLAGAPNVLVGLGATGRTAQGAAIPAVFQQISILAVAGGSGQALLSRGVVLRNGSAVAADVAAMDDSAVRFTRKGEKEATLSTGDVARIVFKPIAGNLAERLPTGRTGVLLSRGDFFEGEIKGLKDGQVRVSSVLFGLKSFGTNELAAVVLGDVAPTAGQYEVRSADGSTLLGKLLAIDKESLVVDEPLAGALRVPVGEVLSIKAGAGRFQSLLALKPAKVDRQRGGNLAEGLVVDRPGGELALRLVRREPAGGLAMGAGTTVSYSLGGAYRTFVCRAGVPEGVLPATPVRVVVIGDGKVLYRGNECLSLDEPQALAVPVAGVQMLSLRVEAAGADLGAVGFWSEPALVK